MQGSGGLGGEVRVTIRLFGVLRKLFLLMDWSPLGRGARVGCSRGSEGE